MAQFAPAPGGPFAAGTTPVAVATGDFNGDGRLDVAVANQDSDTVTILLGNASGGFTPAPGSPLAIGVSPNVLIAGDFNGDGNLDLAIAGLITNYQGFPTPGNLAVWLGDGSGVLRPTPASPITIPTGFTNRISVSAGDFNADGKLDIAVVTDIWFAVLLGDGTGGFTTLVLTDPKLFYMAGIQSGDFNGDGVADFALLTTSGIVVWFKDANGGFTHGPTSSSSCSGPCSVGAADFNGDGKLDLAIAYFGEIQILLGGGDGSFTPAPGSPINTNPVSSLAVADLNGDGHPDLAVTYANTNTATVFLGDGSGKFTTIPGGPFPTGTQPMAVAAGDFNGDGKPDMVTANFGTRDVTLLLNTLPALTTNPAQLQFYAAVGQVAPASLNVTVNSQAGPVATYIVTSDQGWLSATPSTGPAGGTSSLAMLASAEGLAAGSYTGTVRLAAPGYFGAATRAQFSLSNPSGAFVADQGSPFASSNYWDYSSVAIADFNRDGNLDIIGVRNFDSGAVLLLGDGKGGFTAAASSPWPGVQPVSVIVGDFNRDGNPDAAIADDTVPGQVTVLLGDGRGGFIAAPGSPFQTGYQPICMAAADFNRDGNLDFAIGTYNPASGSITILLGNGLGGFTAAAGSPFAGGVSPTSIVSADFNSDGKPDLAVNNGLEITLMLGDGTGGFTPSVVGSYANLPGSLIAADLNGDGKSDLAAIVPAVYPKGANLMLLLGDGSGGFTPASAIPLPARSATLIGVADFNGDGKPDIAIFTYSSLFLFLGDGLGGFTATSEIPYYGPSGAIADLNNDGRPDLVFGNYAFPGGISVLLGSLAPTSATLTTTTPNPVEAGQPVLLTADLTTSGYAELSGTVSFMDGAAVLGTTSLTNNSATFTATLSPGTHNLTATYNGDIRNMVSTPGNTLQVVVCAFTFSPGTVYLDSAGQSSAVNVTANSPACSWTSSAGGFVTVTSGSTGTGNGTVGFTVSANDTGVDRAGTLTVGGQTVSVIQRANTQVFADVPPSAYYFDFTDVLAASGITAGCTVNPPDFCPNNVVTREQMAVFIVTGIEGATFTYTQAPYFTDVPSTSPYFKFIQKLRDLGITAGCSATQFCPNDAVTREQMAAFIIRARYEATPYTYPSTPYFTDVPPTDTFFPFVQKMAQDGITAGCAPNLFCPNATLPRGQMSVFIVTGLLNQLLAAGTPVIAAAAPNSATTGATLTVTLTGTNTHFVQGSTQVVLPPGITPSGVTVAGATSLTVQLAIDAGFVPGPVSIVAVTGAEEAVLPNGFTVH